MPNLKKIAAINIGSYTTRLLIAAQNQGRILQPLKRGRVYTRLAEGFRSQGELIDPAAMQRTTQALAEFRLWAAEYEVDVFRVVCTGVVRRAKNRDAFLEHIAKATGLKAEIISGETEAYLTAQGILNSIAVGEQPYLIFDLGGGSTEFVLGRGDQTDIKSLEIGAAVLSEQFLYSDPALPAEIRALQRTIRKILEQAYSDRKWSNHERVMIGTGGTVTALAAMLDRVQVEEIGHESIHGRVLLLQELRDLWSRLKNLGIAERQKWPGLDGNRAKIIPAGLWIVVGIMDFFQSRRLMVSFSDLLEGMILHYFKGEK